MSSLLQHFNYRVVGQYLDIFAEGMFATLWMSAVCLVASIFLASSSP